nr:hypothetical protein [Citrobacter freundii]
MMHDRREQVGNDETLVVGNDRKMSVKGKQEQTTTGDHVSLVKGMKSLEVKGDLAQKISGALGLKVQDDIVLESSSRISLKVGGSFVVIHPGGVDIMGPKINLNGGGSAGTPVGVMQPGVLEALADDDEGGSVFDELFLLLDDEDNPISFQKYKITTSSGEIYRGITDQDGKTERITTSEVEELVFEYDLDDLE